MIRKWTISDESHTFSDDNGQIIVYLSNRSMDDLAKKLRIQRLQMLHKANAHLYENHKRSCNRSLTLKVNVFNFFALHRFRYIVGVRRVRGFCPLILTLGYLSTVSTYCLSARTSLPYNRQTARHYHTASGHTHALEVRNVLRINK